MGPTQTLADYAVRHRFEDLPDDVVHEAKRSILNWYGVAVGAAHHPTIDIAIETVRDVWGAPVASVLGRSERTDVLHASFLNGTSSHVFDFDDTHLDTIIHPSGPVAAPLFALAERDGLSGRDVIHAFALGVDAECRIGNAVYPAHYDIGWHITATAGVFGAAIASGKVLGLDASELRQAMGLAASQASGLREMFGTMTKPFHVGHAAKSGLFAAMLARKGFTSSLRALEAPRGFANVLSTERDFDEITSELGVRNELMKNAYKPFACGIVIHPTIDGCIQLRDAVGSDVDAVESVDIVAHPLVLELTGKTEPAVGLEGKFSVFHSAAVALIDGAGGEVQYGDDRVLDERVVALRRKVHVRTEPTIREDEVHVTIRMRDGRQHAVHVEHALGSRERPMSDVDLERKFETVAVPVIGERAAREAIDVLWHLDEQTTLDRLVAASVPGSRVAT